MLEQIPRVGRATAKKIYNGYANITDFVNNWNEATDRGAAKGATWNAGFIYSHPMGATEAKVIVSKE